MTHHSELRDGLINEISCFKSEFTMGVGEKKSEEKDMHGIKYKKTIGVMPNENKPSIIEF